MNQRLFNLLNGDKQLYPHLLEEKFPRVFNKLLELWQTPHIEAYLQDLMIDNRVGNREGFPPDAAMEIIRLGNFLHEMNNAGKEIQAWDDVPEYKRHELDQFGYDFRAAASCLDVPVGTVASRVATARARLREALATGEET